MNLYLTEIVLNPRSFLVINCLKNCQSMHKQIMHMFPDNLSASPRATGNILYRLETKEKLIVLVQSEIESDISKLSPSFAMEVKQKEISGIFSCVEPDQIFRFNLFASPCKQVKTNGEETARGNTRRLLKSFEEQMAWLEKKALVSGFSLLHMDDISPVKTIYGERKNIKIKNQGVFFSGILKVTNSILFEKTMRNGLGPAKAYGFGMLIFTTY